MAKSRQISVAETGSINVVTQSVLEGQDLGGLATATTPHGLVSTQAFDLPRDDVYLTAAETARFLGVAKSTVTRRIEKAGLIGFRVFKNALRIPRDQFKNGDVVDGVPNILALFEIVTEGGETAVDHKGAWAFSQLHDLPWGYRSSPHRPVADGFIATPDQDGRGRTRPCKAEPRLR